MLESRINTELEKSNRNMRIKHQMGNRVSKIKKWSKLKIWKKLLIIKQKTNLLLNNYLMFLNYFKKFQELDYN